MAAAHAGVTGVTAMVSPGRRRLPWLTLALAGLALVLYLIAGPAPPALVFDRAGLAQGELWRLVTGHWVHADPSHALWDILALLVLGLLFELLRTRMLPVLIVATVAVDAALWWLEPDLARYCGLSGILNGLLGAGLVQAWRATRSPIVWLVGVGAVVKIAWEWWSGQMLFAASAWPGVPAAHAAGFVAGLIVCRGQVLGWERACSRTATPEAHPAPVREQARSPRVKRNTLGLD